jgi:chemotaxis protein MotB
MARRKKPVEHAAAHADERWLITYADMITLLMGLFIVLYALSDTNMRKFVSFAQSLAAAFSTDVFTGTSAYTVTTGQAVAPDVGQLDAGAGIVAADFRSIQATVSDYAISAGVDGDVTVEQVPQGIAIRISNSLLFDSGRSVLSVVSVGLVDHIGSILSTLHNDVRVEGYTDDVPPDGLVYQDNWHLSTDRAVAVLDRLVADGIKPARLSAAGYGQYHPLVPNVDEASRTTNRRVDVLVLYPSTGTGPTATAAPTPLIPTFAPGALP